MYTEIEKSGIHVRDGLVALKFSFYCEPGDPRYNEHYVNVIDETSEAYKKGYSGKVDEHGMPDPAEIKAWIDSLPKKWQNNPFHNHFDLVSADITDDEIQRLMKKRLTDFGDAWTKGQAGSDALQQMIVAWDTDDKHNKTISTDDRCAIKGLDIAARADSFKRVK